MSEEKKRSFLTQIFAMSLKEKIKMIVTILLCLTIIILVVIVRMQSLINENNELKIADQDEELEELLSELENHRKNDTKPEISVEIISMGLQSAADLTTAEITYTGLVHYSDGSIPFLTEKAFFMYYQADVRAGIDFEKYKDEVIITEDTVTITVPKIEIFEPDIHENSIKFIDEKKAIFNPSSKEDALNAIQAARADLDMNLDAKALMSKATEEAKKIITLFLQPYIGDRTLEIKYQ